MSGEHFIVITVDVKVTWLTVDVSSITGTHKTTELKSERKKKQQTSKQSIVSRIVSIVDQLQAHKCIWDKSIVLLRRSLCSDFCSFRCCAFLSMFYKENYSNANHNRTQRTKPKFTYTCLTVIAVIQQSLVELFHWRLSRTFKQKKMCTSSSWLVLHRFKVIFSKALNGNYRDGDGALNGNYQMETPG